MNMDNNLQKYQAFVKTVETGSFTHAARLLNYAQSSVSKMIADLEKEWGVTLLERSRSGVQLTACGETDPAVCPRPARRLPEAFRLCG